MCDFKGVAKLIYKFKLLIGIYIHGLLQYAVVLQMTKHVYHCEIMKIKI